MQIVKIIGGLGNQLFQYAFGKALEENTGMKVFYDLEDFNEKYKLRKISLQHFNVRLDFADPKEIKRLKSLYNKIRYGIYDLSNGLFINENRLNYYKEENSFFNKKAFSLNNDVYIAGYWQSEKYFSHIKDIIRSDLKFISNPSDTNLIAIDKICNCNSISLHIRRGDYLTNPSAKKIYSICSIEYYENAINFISERVINPIFFVFSDDIQWVKNNLGNKHPMIFVDHNDDDHNYEDLRLMSLCKHHVIANSTFGWWGAWLNNKHDKIIIAPNKWFNDDSRSSLDLIPQNWIRL